MATYPVSCTYISYNVQPVLQTLSSGAVALKARSIPTHHMSLIDLSQATTAFFLLKRVATVH